MCKLISFLYDLIPIRGFRAFLIKKHLIKCAICQNELSIEPLYEEKFKAPEWIESEQSLWPHIREKLSTQRIPSSPSLQNKKRFLIPRWQWALAGFILLVLVGIYLLIKQDFRQNALKGEFIATSTTPRIVIMHAEIEGKKAKPFVYQTQERFFVWFEKSKPEGD